MDYEKDLRIVRETLEKAGFRIDTREKDCEPVWSRANRHYAEHDAWRIANDERMRQ